MKKIWKYHESKVLKGALITACAILFFMGEKSVSFAETTGKVKVPSAKVRQQADANSTAIASSSEGTTVTILSEATDAAGTVWYEVKVNGDTTGYIRSDLIEKDASSDNAEAGQQPSDNDATFATAANTSAPGAEAPAETAMEAQYGVIKVPTAKVRSAASTSNSVVDTLPTGSQVIVSGQTGGSDGKIWYFVNFLTSGGEEKTGYIRSDLLDLGEMVPAPEPVEEPEEEPPVDDTEAEPVINNEYELVYEANKEGELEWYLYDWTGEKGNKQKLAELLAAAHAQSVNNEIDAKTIAKQRIVIIVLIALIILLAIVVTVMIFKLRDAYYEAYEDDEDDEEDDEEEDEDDRKRAEPVKRKSPPREERQPETRKKAVRADRPDRGERPVRSGKPDRSMPNREVTYEEDEAVPVKTAPKRKAKNFMLEDDEFEFEFLNMKDKDRGR